MIIDNLGLPKEMGASDRQDSVRLAGLMSGFHFGERIPLERYIIEPGVHVPLLDDPEKAIIFEKKVYVRHPREYKYDFSRDQFICFAFGLWAIGRADLIDINCTNGKDIFAPSVKGMVAKAKGGQATWLQEKWLKAEMYYHAKFTPLDEPCQLFSMMYVYDRKYVKEYCSMNKLWELAWLRYFSRADGAWRGEPELAEHIINQIKITISL